LKAFHKTAKPNQIYAKTEYVRFTLLDGTLAASAVDAIGQLRGRYYLVKGGLIGRRHAFRANVVSGMGTVFAFVKRRQRASAAVAQQFIAIRDALGAVVARVPVDATVNAPVVAAAGAGQRLGRRRRRQFAQVATKLDRTDAMGRDDDRVVRIHRTQILTTLATFAAILTLQITFPVHGLAVDQIGTAAFEFARKAFVTGRTVTALKRVVCVTFAVIDAKQMSNLWMVSAVVVTAVLTKLSRKVHTVVAVGRGTVAMQQVGGFVDDARRAVVAHVSTAFFCFVFTIRTTVAVFAGAMHRSGRGLPSIGVGDQFAKGTLPALTG
jgi:hypothetical protein